jgi:site-specific recombinase XerD
VNADPVIGPDDPDDRDLARATKYFVRSKSPTTRRVYTRAWAEFVAYTAWRRQRALPATPKAVVGFLSFLADAGASVSSVRQKLAAISWVHRIKKLHEPSQFAEVITLMAGIARSRSSARAAKTPKLVLDRALLAKLVNAIKTPYPVNLRDRALLLVDYFGLLRRSEVVSLRIEDITFDHDQRCMFIQLRQSKTDQAGLGHALPYPELDEAFAAICPVRALRAWLGALESEFDVTEGWLFRRVTRWGKLVDNDAPLTDQVVNTMVKTLAAKVGIPAKQISAHAALRAGMATQLDRDGVAFSVIKRAGRWKSDAVASGYIRRDDKDLLAALRGEG